MNPNKTHPLAGNSTLSPSPPQQARAVHRNPNLVAKQAAEVNAGGNPLLSRLYSSSAPVSSGKQPGVPNILTQNARKADNAAAIAPSAKPTGQLHDTLQLYTQPQFKPDEMKKVLQSVSFKALPPVQDNNSTEQMTGGGRGGRLAPLGTVGGGGELIVHSGDTTQQPQSVSPNQSQLQPPPQHTPSSDPLSIVAKFRGTNANTPKEFTYLTMRPRGPRDMYNPYDLQLSNHKNICPSHYFTISASGVTKFDDGEAEFMELKAWEREHRIFHRLIQFNVFRLYKKWKSFQVWQQLVRRTTVTLYRNFLSDNLFHLHPNLSPTLRDVRRICLDFLRGHNLYQQATETRTLDQFVNSLSSHLGYQRQELEAMIKRIRDEIERACKAAMQTATAAREKELQCGLDVVDDPRKRRKNVEIRDTITNHKPSYIELSQKRAVCRRLTAFIRLCDYIVINSLSALAMKALRDLHADLQYPRPQRPKVENPTDEKNQAGKDKKKPPAAAGGAHAAGTGHAAGGAAGACGAGNATGEVEVKKRSKQPKEEKPRVYFEGMIFNCDILYSTEDEQIQVKPSSTSFAQKVDELVKEYIRTVSTIPRFAQMDVFRVYTEHGSSDNGDEFGMGPDVGEMVAAEDEYKSLTLSLRSSLAASFGAVEKYAREFEPFRMMHLRNNRLDTEEIKRNNEPLDFFRDRLAMYKQQSEDIERKIPNSKNVALFNVHTEALRDFFTPSPLACLKAFHDLLPVIAHEKNEAMLKDMASCNNVLDKQPETVEEYVAYMAYFTALENRIDTVNHEFEFLRELFTLLAEEKVHISEEDDETYRSGTRPQYEKMRTLMQNIEDGKESQQRYFAKNIEEQMDGLKVRIAEVAVSAKNPLLEDENADQEKVMALVQQLQSESQAIAQREKELRRFQVSFSIDETPIDTLEDMLQEVQLKAKLWGSVQSWASLTEEYHQAPLKTLDTTALQDQVNKYTTTVKQVCSKLPTNQAAHKLRRDVEGWRAMTPVIVALKNPKIEGHNKQRLEQVIGKITDANGNEKMYSEVPDVTLAMLLAKNIFEEVGDEIIAISRTATEEDKLEQMLQKVHGRWISGGPKPAMEFQLNNHKDVKDLYVLAASSVEEITAELEESSIQVSTISSSKYCTGFLREKVERWERNLKVLQETLDKWLEFQRNWIYLENIFSSPEIRNQWKEDATTFLGVDTQFRARMRRVHDAPNVYRSIIVDETKAMPLLEIFERDNKKLEHVLASLERKLEEKRRSFPRFYFLSNDDLLDILAKIKQPELIMAHMLKMFDGIKTLTFTPSNDITHLHSMEGERVELQHKGIKAGRGQVEVWLGALEKEMFSTLRVLAKKCLEDFEARGDRLEWIFQHPVQLVLIMSQMFWTRNVERALDQENSRELMGEVRDENYAQLGELAGLTGQKLSKVQRSLLSTLITLDVHARDLVDEMYENGVTRTAEFGWTKQLRVTWEIDDSDGHGNIFIRQNNSRFVYGYEYLGAQGRLVITPLTDRIYMTITGALKLYLGAAPAGPAGTGKTETVKDMAKNLARQCIVYNCSDGVTYKMMEKFFSGLIQTGAWTCLDEFNRINIEVLSVIASQVLEIKLALQSKQDSFTFQGTPGVRIRATYGVFVTMNPGYAGRTELPDNLKILFRPVAVMTPDFRMIAEVILYSEGFRNAKELSLKITQLYKLSSEQLSPQDHYDFGMRALKSILVMAGDLKRSQPDVEEDLTLIVACNDSNVPKFVAEDLPLFRGVMQDLFPGTTFPEREYAELLPAMQADMEEKALIHIDSWVKKGIQFYETLIVRHGVMLVGVTGTGKSESRNCIANALTTMSKNGSEDKMARLVNQYVMNPKSIMLHELYGILDPMTNEWKDGVLAVIAKQCVRASEGNNEHRWIVFDGPVDTLWIESMNSVLDDSKLLCLDNGERIKLPDTIHMLFEVGDLAVASPATVSRCGMVYVDSEDLPWQALLGKWAKTKLAQFAQPQCAEYIVDVIEKHVPPALEFMAKQTVLIGGGPGNMVQSLLDLYTALLHSLNVKLMPDPQGETTIPPDDPIFRERNELCNLLFGFCFVWSFGGNLDSSMMENFDNFARDLLENVVRMPNNGMLFDFYPDIGIRQFQPWESQLKDFVYNPAIPFFDIIVPTVDTVRYSFLVKTLLENEKPVLLNGQTGVGKSVLMNDVLNVNKDTLGLQVIVFQFSAQTSSERTQELIESKLKQKRKNILGAPPDRKVVLFIDDLNMPALEVFGASPPIELLRQIMGNGGFYDRKIAGAWKYVQDVTVVAACGPPEGGRNPVTMRLTRMFHLLQIPTLSEDSMKRIFVSILSGFFEEKNFNREVKDLAKNMIIGAVELFQRIREELRPRPATPHYTYNLRDLAKVCQGLMQVIPRVCNNATSATRLWIHECMRCLYDRLTNAEDRHVFTEEIMLTTLKRLFPGNHSHEEYFEREPIMWGDFLRMGAAEKVYEESTDIKKVFRLFDEYLDDYNAIAMSSKEATRSTSMNLVFFTDHCKHLARIIRVIRQIRGNALLVGVGGSGKRSLTRLATHIAEYKRFEISVGKGYSMADFHETLLEMYRHAGVKCKPLVFILSDDQIVHEGMLEDVNNILNSGEVPSLFPPDERDKMINSSAEAARETGITHRDEIYNYFINRARDNMHVVLCMSPVGDAFRTRCRQFPSLTNCCSIDWFDEWPAEALLGVAQRLLSNLNVEGHPEDLREKLINLCVDVHLCVEEAAENFWEQLRRRYYITPTSYLEFINLFISMLDEKTQQQNENLSRFVNGKQKMIETDSMIASMKKDIEEKQPLLEVASQETERVVADLKVRSESASVVQAQVAEQQAEAAVQQKTASAIATEANARLAEAQPIMDAAKAALKTIEPSHINELKVLNTGPRGALLTCNAVMTFFDPKDMPGWSGAVDWKGCREFLAVRGLIDKIENYDVKNVKPQILQRIKKYINDPENFNPDEVRKRGSEVCGPLCEWVLAVDRFAAVYKEVVPLEESAAKANAELAETNAKLAKAKAQLKEVEDELNQLQKNYDTSIKRKELLEKELNVSKFRLKNAVQLSESLKNEGGRWETNIAAIGERLKSLPINVFLSTACMAYYGALTPKFRDQLVAKWVEKAQEKGFDVPSFSLVDAMGDPMETLTWQIAGLPTDDTSTENAIIVNNSNPPRRWPLLIDPQGQALKWLTTMQKKADNLKIVKMTDKSYLRTIEMAIEQGKTVILADVGEVLDPALDPLLNRQIFSHDGDAQITMSRQLNYRPTFRFFICTKLANPHYLPDVSTKVTLVNFTVTMDGLENQMLGEVVSIEKRELEEENNRTTKSISDGQTNLKEMEEGILKRLKNVQGNILDDEELITTLQKTQRDAATIAKSQEVAVVKMEDIRKIRELYRSVARRASILYFVLADLALIDPMYQYSLEYFKNLCANVVSNTAKPEGYDPNTPSPELLEEHLLNLIDGITETTYVQICRGLFNKDKTILSLLISTSIARDRGDITEPEWQFFVRASALVANEVPPKPDECSWMTRQQWELVDALTRTVPAFAGFMQDVVAQQEEWKALVLSSAPHEEPMPAGSKDWEGTLTSFQRILVIRAFREEKLLFALTNYVRDQMGQRFTEPPPFNIERAFKDSSVGTPIVFILSQGSDPMNMLQSFAKFNEKVLQYVSLGQGQGENAKRLIEACKKSGDWAMLQNCHLSKTFMPELESQVAVLQNAQGVNPNFRLWLTSTPAPFFPVSVLQNSIKLTNEAPTGLKANMIRCFNEIHQSDFEVFGPEDRFPECSKEHAYKKLMYGLCFFHSVVLERKKFGPLGWNVRYEWNDTDFHVSKQWLRLFFEEQAQIPWDSLEYIIGQINYGGRVTDPQDRGTLITILRIYLNKHLLLDGYSFSASGNYKAPPVMSLEETREYLTNMSPIDDPEVFGMHENANLRYQLQISEALMNTVLLMQPRLVGHKGEGMTPEEQVMQKCKDFEEVLPDVILREEAGPHSFTTLDNGLPNSLSTVLSHELVKYNKLLSQMRWSLTELQKALKGLSVLSEDLDKMYQSFLNDQVPQLWSNYSYSSLKPLGSWFRELVEKVSFIRGWVRKGEPTCFWIAGFFNPTAFMTGMLQAYARAEGVSVDKLGFSYKMIDTPPEQIADQPSRGCYVYGIFSDAWRWDPKRGVMVDSLPGEPYASLPVLHFLPEPHHKLPPHCHRVPMYRTTLRAGVISSLGASSNYVLSIEVPSANGSDYWTLKGAACVCALNV